MKVVEWLEPCPGGPEGTMVVVQRMKVEQAIDQQKGSAALKGFSYPSDEMALDDFCVVHWAVVKEIE